MGAAVARAAGVDRLWIANVGDLKPMELPISFFLDYAWKPEAYGPDAGRTYLIRWATEQFGPAHAEGIADILDRETRYAARRTPELTAAGTWDVSTEWPRIVADYDRLEADAIRIASQLTPDRQDSFYELVLHPVQAFANLHRLYQTVALNHAHAAAGLPDAAALADQARVPFAKDGAIAARYEGLAGDKWTGMMTQTHIGYTGWQQLETNIMPPVGDVSAAMAAPSPAYHPVSARYVAVDAVHGEAEESGGARCVRVEGLGRVGAAMTVLPRVTDAFAPGKGPALRFTITVGPGTPLDRMQLLAAPSLPTVQGGRLRVGVQVDGGAFQTIEFASDASNKAWAESVEPMHASRPSPRC